MRSETKISGADNEILVPVAGLSALEIERTARAYRARIIGELLADAIVWVMRLPRRLAEPAEPAARRQRV
jgi:hypothetical protein